MKRVNFYIIVIALLIIMSCKEKETTAPKEEKPQDVVIETSIGPQGGKLEKEGFELNIPSGAFIEIADLKLYEEPDSNEFDDNQVSSIFRIDGIPLYFQKPLRLAVKYKRAISNNSYLAVGEDVVVKSLSKIATTYCLFEASDSSGYLVCNLSTESITQNRINNQKASSIYNWIKLVGVTNLHSRTSSDLHFKVTGAVNNTTNDQLTDVASKCEKAYQTYMNLNLSYDKRKQWPIPIFVKNIKSDPGFITNGYYTGSSFLEDHGYIVINVVILNNNDKLSTVIGHEFLHLIQELYDPRTWDEKMKEYGKQYWLDEATAVYSEEFFSNEPINYISGAFQISPLAPFAGFHKEGQTAGDHGYGMASVIKYLCQNFQTSSIVNFYTDINLNKHPIETIIDNSNGSTDWVAPFFRTYVEGKIYNRTTQYWIDSRIEDYKFKVKSNTDTLKTFSYLYPDLSGELFLVELENPNWKKNTNIFFTLLGKQNFDTEISVFRYKDTGLPDYISSNYSQVKLNNIEEVTASGFNLMALVTNGRAINPYTEETSINLQIDLKEPTKVVKNYTKAYINLHIKGFNIRTTADSSYEDPYYEFYETSAPEQTGSLTDSIFTSSWNYQETKDIPLERTVVTWKGSIQIIFSSNFDEIISYTETNSENWPGWRTTTMGVSVKNIPHNEADSYLLNAGEKTCGYVVSRNYQLNWYDGKSVTFSRNECDSESYIKIDFYD